MKFGSQLESPKGDKGPGVSSQEGIEDIPIVVYGEENDSSEGTERPTESREEREEFGPEGEEDLDFEDFLSTENKSFFSRMSEGGKRIASQAYEFLRSEESLPNSVFRDKMFEGGKKMYEGGKKLAGGIHETLYKIPGVNNVVGKLEIAYSQFWLHRHEEKAYKHQGRADELDTKIASLDQSREKLESLARMSGQDVSGELAKIESKKEELLRKMGEAQGQFDARASKAGLYQMKRDAVADKLIGHYDLKLQPIERELEHLHARLAQEEQRAQVAEASHRKQQARLAEIEKQKNQLEKSLPKWPIARVKRLLLIKRLEKIIDEDRERMLEEQANIVEKISKARADVVAMDAEALPHRKNRDEFLVIKEGRPLVGSPETPQDPDGSSYGDTYSSEPIFERAEPRERAEGLNIESYLKIFASYLLRESDPKYSSMIRDLVNSKDFLRTIQAKFSVDQEINFDIFKKLIAEYFKVKKIPTDGFDKIMNGFSKYMQSKK